MIKKELKGIGQDVYIETLDNGLKIYLVPFKNRKNYYINYVTKFGSINNKFVPANKNEVVKVPYGVAHFLEHKMFEQEDGIDPFKFFSKYGSDANASTGYKTTSYTVNGVNNIEENLDFLLTYVNSPYFTEENIEKEKNIIIEEINMYNDEPEGKLYEKSSKAIFKYHPMRIDIGGTEKSVRSINKENLYDCYNTFYQPSNMSLFIGGNFEVDKIIKVIKNNKALQSNSIKEQIKVETCKEPLKVNSNFEEIKIENLVIPKLIFTLKISLKELHEKERFKYTLLLNLLIGILYGGSSQFREQMLNEGKMSIFATSKAIVDDFLILEFMAESKVPKELADNIKKVFIEKEITEEEIKRHKKIYIANEVLKSDQVVSTVNMITANVIDYNDIIYDKIDMVKNISIDDILDVRKTIDIENSSLVIAYPKE
ncbi:MAG: insulinase family protein [Bacilli bacterium]|nr:insulinase family protein [Bacilli bacterium]